MQTKLKSLLRHGVLMVLTGSAAGRPRRRRADDLQEPVLRLLRCLG